LPNVLVIHVKRFYYEGMDYKKIDEAVNFEKVVDIQSRQNQIGKYELYGIVHHFGTKNAGHYIA